MERKLVNTSILFLLIAFTLGCSDGGPTISDEGGAAIIGKIVDSNGNLLEGVGVHYIPKLVDSEPTGFAKITPATIISYSIPEPTEVTMYILRYGSRDTVAFIMHNQPVDAGNYSLEFTADTLTNGVYYHVIEYDNQRIEKKWLMFRYAIDLSEATPLTKTSNEGYFELPYNIMGIGEEFMKANFGEEPYPVYISPEISIVFTWGINSYYVEELIVDKFIKVEKTFTLPN